MHINRADEIHKKKGDPAKRHGHRGRKGAVKLDMLKKTEMEKSLESTHKQDSSKEKKKTKGARKKRQIFISICKQLGL